jgi:hypothetical protein
MRRPTLFLRREGRRNPGQPRSPSITRGRTQRAQPFMRRSFLGTSLGAALILCLVILLVSLARWERGYRPRFPLEHSNVAFSLASGGGYSNPFGVSSGPTAWVPPGIPLAYAGAIELARVLRVDERVPIVGFNFLAAASAVFLILRFCIRGWSPASRTAFCVAFLGYGILDPDFLASSGPLTAAGSALLLAGLAETNRQPGRLAAWVLIFGANCLLAVTHPGLALAGLLASMGIGLRAAPPDQRKPAFARSAAFAAIAGIALTSGPWTLRNHAVFGQWIPAKSNGCFELVLSQRETDNGILSEASLLVGHPSTNPRLLADYVRLGERGFLEPYRHEAAEIVESDLGRYCMFSLNRLFNAICFSSSPADIEALGVRPEPGQAARLVGRRLILMCTGTPDFFWAKNAGPESVERVDLKSAGVDDTDLLLADWSRAQAIIKARTEGFTAGLTGFAWSGFPTLCLASVLIFARRSAPRLMFASAAIYLVALIPNILITHDIRHQASFMLLFAVLFAGAAEALVRRKSAP